MEQKIRTEAETSPGIRFASTGRCRMRTYISLYLLSPALI